MNEISFDELKQIIGNLFIENILLKKKIGYLESMVEQLRPKKMSDYQEKEVKPDNRSETKNGD